MANVAANDMNVSTGSGARAIGTAQEPGYRTGVVYQQSGKDDMHARDGARWGPILAGFVTAITTLVVLSVLGLAIGLSVFEPGQDGARDATTAATIWGAASGILAFLLGGWVAGRTAGVYQSSSATLNGFLVGALALVAVLWLTTAGLSNLLGSIGGDVDQISRIAAQNGQNAGQNARAAYDEAQAGAWGTFAGLAIALAAAAVGGFVGHMMKPRERDVAADTELRQAA